VLPLPAGGDVRLGAVGALETAKVTSLSDGNNNVEFMCAGNIIGSSALT